MAIEDDSSNQARIPDPSCVRMTKALNQNRDIPVVWNIPVWVVLLVVERYYQMTSFAL